MLRLICIALLGGLLGVTALLKAAPPRDLAELAPVEELTIEVRAQTAALENLLANEASFEAEREKKIWQSFGLLAVLGQALAERPEGGDSGVPGPQLRAAAKGYDHKADYEAARQTLAAVQAALAGQGDAAAHREHPWQELVNMHPMMEEMNGRNSALLRVLRRPRGTPEEAANATVWVVLGAAMKADAHEVKDPADLPQWNAWSDDFIQSAAKLAEAIRAKDRDEARVWFDKANAACDACHEKFRDQ